MSPGLPRWTECVANPEAVLAYYSQPLSLNQVEFAGVTFLESRAAVQFAVFITEIPRRLSPRWPAGTNVIRLDFDLDGVQKCSMVGWAHENLDAHVTLRTLSDGNRHAEARSRTTSFDFVCERIMITKVEGFRRNVQTQRSRFVTDRRN